MFVDEQFRKCVAFVVANTSGSHLRKEIQPVATAFFVTTTPLPTPSGDGSPPDEQGEGQNVADLRIFAVTARHVVDASRVRGGLALRVNTVGGGTTDLATQPDDWTPHPTADVSVLSLQWQNCFDCQVLPLHLLADDEYVHAQKLVVGSDIFFIGLFSEHPGVGRNQPIVRFGRIARMRDDEISFEPVPGQVMKMDAFLVEAQSWGGHSGSPAWVSHPFIINAYGKELFNVTRPGVAVLGLVSGHYDIAENVAMTGDMGEGHVRINAGIAVVVPAERILETLREVASTHPEAGPVSSASSD